jgi:31-O-methyltransferase
MAHVVTLPNGHDISHVNSPETALLYRNIVAEKCYLRYGVTLSRGDTVFDVGANIGMATMSFHWSATDVRVYAFEPAPGPFHALSENMTRHRVAGAAFPIALGAKGGSSVFTYYPNSTIRSGLLADAETEKRLTRTFLQRSGLGDNDIVELLETAQETQTFECPVSTLSTQISELEVATIDLLKVDAEKSEIDVLRGIDETDWPKIRQVVAEVHDLNGALATAKEILHEHGFEVIQSQDRLLAGTEIYMLHSFRTDG